MTIEKSILEKSTKALKNAYASWFLIDTSGVGTFNASLEFGSEADLEPLDTKDTVFTVTHKGVIIEQKDIRNIKFKIIDLKGNVVTFIPHDIPQLIEDLKEAYEKTFSKKGE